MGRRPIANLKSVRTAIGTALCSLNSDVLNGPLPERIAELLGQFDPPEDDDGATPNNGVCHILAADNAYSSGTPDGKTPTKTPNTLLG
jgi:hypothetical protein